MDTIQNTMLVLLVVGGLLAFFAGNSVLGFILIFVAMGLGKLKDKYPNNGTESTGKHRASKKGFSTESASKKCPDCAEIIKYEAIICRYCGKEQPDGKKTREDDDKNHQNSYSNNESDNVNSYTQSKNDKSNESIQNVNIKETGTGTRWLSVALGLIISMAALLKSKVVYERLDYLNYNLPTKSIVIVIAIIIAIYSFVYILKHKKSISIINKLNIINSVIFLILCGADDKLLDIGASSLTPDQDININQITANDTVDDRIQKLKRYNQQLSFKLRAIENRK